MADDQGELIAGPWLNDIPAPQMPLQGAALVKYQELARRLYDQGKLTSKARDLIEVAALNWGGLHLAAEFKRTPSTAAIKEYNKAIDMLNLEEAAQPIAGRNGARKYATNGFADRIAPPKN